MIILDTDHVSALQAEGGELRDALVQRMRCSSDRNFAVTVITLEEQMKGWMAEINHTLDFARQVGSYRRLAGMFAFFSALNVLHFDEVAAEKTIGLRKAKVRIGTMDLKIASIALSQDVLLLTANARDFAQVPGLRFENWLH
ncbi:MAG: type II toxin-antitoxin system VapC family toxin [Prosthecobacter sp.]|uniref:type II toxin-antitoxin system VapC family toxin n=1 Tax=Prosthecobacter sp. TaxID=1965333 RepID=UPI0039024578